MVSIQSSQIVENGTPDGTPGVSYGVYNGNPQDTIVSAPNNWWGDPSGPTFGGQCGTGGTGSRVSGGVDFAPILTSTAADPSPLSPTTLYALTLEPERWYVPADGVLPAVIVATLRDGAGRPVPGRVVRATSSRGIILDGGITDATGKTTIELTSNQAGDANVVARVEQPNNPCDMIRRASTTITPPQGPPGRSAAS